jgi:glycerophosphoryl diester phosphodiesterase
VRVIAHRGAKALAPENTLAAFRLARELGADGVELDVHPTADGELVVIHDHDASRTTDGRGLVADLTAAEVARLDAGSWFGPAHAGEPVPLLRDVVALDGLELELDLKGTDRAFLARVLAVVRAADAFDRAEFTSGDTPMLMALKAMEPAARFGLFTPRREPWMPAVLFERLVLGRAEFAGADVVHVAAADITPAITDRLHERGHVVLANDASSPDEVRRAIAAGADRLTTDDPAMAVPIARDA